MAFDFDAYLANKAAEADGKLQAVIDASREKVAGLQAYDAAKQQTLAPNTSWSGQLGLEPGGFASNRVNDVASFVSGASRLAGQVASLPVSINGGAYTTGVEQSHYDAYNRHVTGNATPEDLSLLEQRVGPGGYKAIDAIKGSLEQRSTARAINDAADLTGIVDQHNRQGLSADLAAGFQPNWDKVQSGEAGKVVSGVAGLLLNAGSAIVKNPSAVREYIIENAPQLFVGAAGKLGQGAMAASNIGYAVDEFQKGMENFAKENGGALPPVEQQHRMALQAASLAVAEEAGDLVGLHGAHALGLGEKELARTSFLQSMKNVGKGAAEGLLGEAPTEGFQQYMEGQVEGKDQTPEQIYEAAVIGGASGAGLSGGGRALVEAAKASPAHVAERADAAQKVTDHAAMIQSGDVSSITDPKSGDYAPAQAIAALHGHSQLATTDEATKQANLTKADEILSALEKERNVTAANQLDPAKRQAHIDDLKQQLAGEQDPEFQQMLKDEITQQEAEASKPVDKAEMKKRQGRLALLDEELAQARQNRQALGGVVTPQASVDDALKTLQDPAQSQDHGTAADKVITLAMSSPDRVDPAVAGQIAADTSNGLTDSQRSYLRSFSEARVASNELMNMGKVSQAIYMGDKAKGDVGISQYRSSIAASVAAGDKPNAYRQLSALQRFADSHTGKAEAAREAMAQGFGTQIQRTKGGEWFVATPAQNLSPSELQKNGGLAIKSSELVSNIGTEADAISKTAQEMTQAYALKFTPAKAQPTTSKTSQAPAAAPAATTTTNPNGATGANDVQNTAREGQGTQAQPQAPVAEDPVAAGTGSATTGQGAVSDTGARPGDVQAAGVSKVPLKDGGHITIQAVPAPKAFSSLVRLEHGEPIALVATNEQGEEVGRLTYMPKGGPIDSSVREQDRRRGVGSALYAAHEAAGGKLPGENSGVVISDAARALRQSRTAAREAQTEGTSGSSVSSTEVNSAEKDSKSTETSTATSSQSSAENQSTQENTAEPVVKAEQQPTKAAESSSTVTKSTDTAALPAAPAGQLRSLTEKSPEGTVKPFQEKKLGDFVTQTAGKEGEKTLQRPLVAVKDFLSNLTGDSLRQFTGLTEFSEEQKRVLRLFKSTAVGWFDNIQANLLKREGENAHLFFYNDVMQFLIEGSGKNVDLEENLKTAMAFAGFSWIAENATRPVLNDDEEINAILGREESHQVTQAEREILAEVGTRQNLVINTLGQRVVQALGLKANRDAPKDILPKLQAALGAHVMKLLVDQGIVERNTVEGAVMAELTGKADTKSEASNFFLHLSDKNSAVIEQIAKATMGTQGVMGKLFGVDEGMKEPSIGTPIPFTQKTTKNTDQKVPAKLAKIVASKNATPWTVRQDLWALMQQLSNDTMVEIAGGEDLDGKHGANQSNTKAMNDGLLREVTNFRQFVGTMKDLEAGLYFEHTVWKQQRVGIATNVINPQSSKVHRHMLSLASWKAEVDTTNAGQMDNFKLRVLEGLGVKTDKQANATSLAGFNALFDAKQATSEKDAAKAKTLNAGVRVLMDMLAGEDMTPAKEAALVAAVAAGGENMHSLDALMAVAHWKFAEKKGKTTFTAQLMGEVDGVTNGPMLTHLLLGAAASAKELFGLLNRGGFFQLGSIQTQYNLWKSASAGNTDLYETTARHITEEVRGLMNNGVVSSKGKKIFSASEVKGAMSAIYRFTGELVKDDKVTKDGRNIVKTPLTAMVFGSQVSKAVDSMANNFIESIYAKIEDSAAGRSTASASEIIDSVNTLLDMGRAAKLSPNLSIEQLMKTQLTVSQVEGIKKVFTLTVGNAVRGTMEHDFAEFITRRKQLNDAAQLAFALHNSVHAAMRDELIAELTKSGEIATNKAGDPIHDLNAKQEAELQKRLAKALPIMHTLMSKESGDLSSGLLVSKADRKISQRSVYGNEVKFGTKFDDNKAGSTRVKAMETEGISPGVAMVPMSVHSTDSAISHIAADGHEVLNIHDAHGTGVSGFAETAQRLNRATWEAMLAYSPAHEMSATLARTVQGLAELVQSGELPPAAMQALSQAIDKLAARQEMEPAVYLQSVFATTRQMAAQADRTKLEALAQMAAIDQYALEGGNYQVTEADRAKAQALAEKVSDKVTAEEQAAIDAIEKAMATAATAQSENVGATEAVSGEALAEKETNESVADTAEKEDTLPKPAVTTSPFGTLGQPAAGRSDPAISAFFAANPNTTAKAVIEFLYGHLKTQAPTANRDYSAKLLSKLRQILPADLKVQLVTQNTQALDVLGAPKTPAQGWYVARSAGQAIYVVNQDFTHSAMKLEVLLHEMVHAATAIRLEHPDAKVYKAELEALLEAAREHAKKTGNIKYDKNALSSVDELIAYGMTNQGFQATVLAQVKIKSTVVGGFTSGMKAFVTTLAKLLGFKTSADANGLGVLIANVTGLFEQQKDAKTAAETKEGPVLSMAAEMNSYSTMDILHGLDGGKGSVGPAFQDHLRDILGSIVQNLHGPFGSFKADLMENQAGTPMDVWAKALATGQAPFSSGILASGLKVSSQEAFAIEQVEATVRSAINASEARTKVAYRELAQLYEEVYRNAKASDFHEGDWAKATPAEKQAANDLFESVFKLEKAANAGNRSDYLARFAALGLGHQGVNRVLQRATERNTRKAGDAQSFADRLQAVFESILDFFRSKMTHTYAGQNADAKLRTLVEQLVDIEAKNRARLVNDSAKESLVERFEAKGKDLNEKLHNKAEAFLNSSFLRNNTNAVVRGVGSVARTIAGNRVDQFLEVIAKMRDEHLGERHGVLMSLINEAKGPNEQAKFLLLATKHNEQLRKKLIDGAASTSLSMFSNNGKDLSEDAKAAVTQAFLRAGAHALLDHFDMAQIEGILSDPKQLKAAVTQFEGQLTGNVRGYYLAQARALGYFKATGRVTSQLLMMNAGNIAQAFGTGFQSKINEEAAAQAEGAISPLVSLYALSYLNPELMQQAATTLKDENARGKDGNGVEFVLKLHKQLESESRDRLFEGSHELMIHGYTPEIFNPNTEIQIADAVAGQELMDRGWSKGAEVPVDPHDPDRQRRHVYVLRGAGLGARQTGIVSWTNIASKGTEKHSGFLNPRNQNGLANAQLNATVLNARQDAVSKMLSSGATFDPTKVESTFMAPIVNPQGDVVNWRYLMQESTKDNLLERDNRFEHILGSLAGSIFDKETTAEQNKKAMTALKEQYDAEYAEHADRYILVGPNSNDPELRETWALLPDVTKRDVHAIWGRDGVFVRKDSLDIVFGYRKLSAARMFSESLEARKRREELGLPASVWDLDSDEYNMLQKLAIMSVETMLTVWARAQGMDQAAAEAYSKRAATLITRSGRMWNEVVAETKDLIVVKTGTVMLDNIWSNLSLLVINGVPLKDIVHHHMVALKGATAYHADSNELAKLKLMLDSGHTLGQEAQIKRDILRLEDSIARNPITELVNAGLMPSIVEDIASEDDIYSYKSALMRKAEGVTSKIPESLRNIGKTIYMTHDTPLYQGLSRVTQLSDFVARYTLYQHLTNRKNEPLSKKDALSRAVDSFIMYDIPMHPLLQYADDTGFFMFTKYFLRIQRVLRTMWHDNPARMLSALLLDHTLGLGPIVLDSAAALRIGNNPMDSGAFKFFGSLDQLATVKPVISVFK